MPVFVALDPKGRTYFENLKLGKERVKHRENIRVSLNHFGVLAETELEKEGWQTG